MAGASLSDAKTVNQEATREKLAQIKAAIGAYKTSPNRVKLVEKAGAVAELEAKLAHYNNSLYQFTQADSVALEEIAKAIKKLEEENTSFLEGQWENSPRLHHVEFTLFFIGWVVVLGFIILVCASFASPLGLLAIPAMLQTALPFIIPFVLWGLLLLTGTLLDTTITHSFLSNHYELKGESTPEAWQVFYSHSAVALALLLGAGILPFLAATVFPGLLAGLAATAVIPAMPWLILILSGVFAAAVTLFVIAVAVDVTGVAPGFVGEFFGSLLSDAEKKLVEVHKNSRARKQSLGLDATVSTNDEKPALAAKLLGPNVTQAGKKEFERVPVPLIEYKQEKQGEFFIVLAKNIEATFPLKAAAEGTNAPVNSEKKEKPSPVETLHTLCAKAAEGIEAHGAQFQKFDQAIEACRKAGKAVVDMHKLQPVVDRLGQYKATVMLESLKQGPTQAMEWMESFPTIKMKNEAGHDWTERPYAAMIQNIPLAELKKLSELVSEKLSASKVATSDAKNASPPAASSEAAPADGEWQNLSGKYRTRMERFQEAIGAQIKLSGSPVHTAVPQK